MVGPIGGAQPFDLEITSFLGTLSLDEEVFQLSPDH